MLTYEYNEKVTISSTPEVECPAFGSPIATTYKVVLLDNITQSQVADAFSLVASDLWKFEFVDANHAEASAPYPGATWTIHTSGGVTYPWPINNLTLVIYDYEEWDPDANAGGHGAPYKASVAIRNNDDAHYTATVIEHELLHAVPGLPSADDWRTDEGFLSWMKKHYPSHPFCISDRSAFPDSLDIRIKMACYLKGILRSTFSFNKTAGRELAVGDKVFMMHDKKGVPLAIKTTPIKPDDKALVSPLLGDTCTGIKLTKPQVGDKVIVAPLNIVDSNIAIKASGNELYLQWSHSDASVVIKGRYLYDSYADYMVLTAPQLNLYREGKFLVSLADPNKSKGVYEVPSFYIHYCCMRMPVFAMNSYCYTDSVLAYCEEIFVNCNTKINMHYATPPTQNRIVLHLLEGAHYSYPGDDISENFHLKHLGIFVVNNKQIVMDEFGNRWVRKAIYKWLVQPEEFWNPWKLNLCYLGWSDWSLEKELAVKDAYDDNIAYRMGDYTFYKNTHNHKHETKPHSIFHVKTNTGFYDSIVASREIASRITDDWSVQFLHHFGFFRDEKVIDAILPRAYQLGGINPPSFSWWIADKRNGKRYCNHYLYHWAQDLHRELAHMSVEIPADIEFISTHQEWYHSRRYYDHTAWCASRSGTILRVYYESSWNTGQEPRIYYEFWTQLSGIEVLGIVCSAQLGYDVDMCNYHEYYTVWVHGYRNGKFVMEKVTELRDDFND